MTAVAKTQIYEEALARIKTAEAEVEKAWAEFYAIPRQEAVASVAPKAVAQAPAAKHKPGPQPKAKAGAKKEGKTRGTSLKKTIFEILDRGPKGWGVVKDLPQGVQGLKASEIKQIIKEEGSWTTDGDPDQQISTNLWQLKEAEKIARGDDRRYFVVEGATMD